MSSKLIIITGGSTSGKSSVCQKLITHDACVQYKPFTTRPVRENETNSDYRHVENKTFEAFIKQGELLFWDHLFENYYGVGKDIQEFIALHSCSLIILPAWRVDDFLNMTQANAVVFHFINTEMPTAQLRLQQRSSTDHEDRMSDLVRQNNIQIENSIRDRRIIFNR